MLAQHGVTAAMLDRQQLRHLEPALAGPAVRAALRTMTDTQIVSHGQHLGRGWQGTAVAPGQWLGSGIWAVAGGGTGCVHCERWQVMPACVFMVCGPAEDAAQLACYPHGMSGLSHTS